MRVPLTVAARNQRADQWAAAQPAAQEHRPQHRPSPPHRHRGQPQHHALQAPRPGLSPQRLYCPLSQPPTEVALSLSVVVLIVTVLPLVL